MGRNYYQYNNNKRKFHLCEVPSLLFSPERVSSALTQERIFWVNLNRLILNRANPTPAYDIGFFNISADLVCTIFWHKSDGWDWLTHRFPFELMQRIRRSFSLPFLSFFIIHFKTVCPVSQVRNWNSFVLVATLSFVWLISAQLYSHC